MLFQSKKKPSPRLKRSALHIPSRKPWPKLCDPKPPPRPRSAPRRASWSPSDAQRKPHALAMRCRLIGSVCVASASASTQPLPSLPFPNHGAQPRLARLLVLGAARRNQAPWVALLLPPASPSCCSYGVWRRREDARAVTCFQKKIERVMCIHA
jgi:hypothetical protein